jgi:FMN reductase (NADPH)
MNDTIRLLKNHRSIRKFKDVPVTGEQLSHILDAAQMASTSSNMQAYSVIGVTDPDKKALLAEYSRNEFVRDSAIFLVWCADLSRIQLACEMRGGNVNVPGTVEHLLVATVDTALAAQNAAIAAESMGLGIVYIGGIRNSPREVSDLLKLPRLMYPVFGMCVGVPDHQPGIKPRQPRAAVYHENEYSDEGVAEALAEYDETMRRYYLERTGGKRDATWTQEMEAKMRQPGRLHMRQFLHDRGFTLE